MAYRENLLIGMINMNWEAYSKKFTLTAMLDNKSDEYINDCLNYANKIFINGLPVIFDQLHLSELVGMNLNYLIKASNSPYKFYREFIILKKNGEPRLISEPLPNLKVVQRWILDEILTNIETSKYAKAYKKNISIKDNARFHRGQKKLLTVDISNYFGSISFARVLGFFKEIGYSKAVSTLLAGLCALEGSLPQGSPTSPALSNLITRNLDKRISSYAKKNNIRYTRYADDITLSGDFNEGSVINFLEYVLKSEGFEINESKTRVRLSTQQQEVTGIIVNEKLQTSKSYRKDFRKNIYYIKKYGLNSHLEHEKLENKKNYLYRLLGMGNFILYINPKDEECREGIAFLKSLLPQPLKQTDNAKTLLAQFKKKAD